MATSRGWIGVDLDGTLVEYGGWVSAEHLGRPVEKMVTRVKQWLSEGQEVRIFTARAYPLPEVIHPSVDLDSLNLLNARYLPAVESVRSIREFCLEQFGKELSVTCVKDYGMIQLWDDRAIQIIENTGVRADGKV